MERIPRTLFLQSTIARPVTTDGVGIHTGRKTHLKLRPAAPNTGIVFRRTDQIGPPIRAVAREVSSVTMATAIGRNGNSVTTIEHLLAAARVRDIDNLIVELDGGEVPILDGSSLPYLRLLQVAGRRLQPASRRILEVTQPVIVETGDKSIQALPYRGLRIEYAIDFPNPGIGRQEIDLVVDGESFQIELAPARTFGFLEDVVRLRSAGLGLGGNSDNCIVFGDEGPINTTLRFPDEPVRHKALDAVGDLALMGAPIWAHLRVDRGGHQLHYSLLEALRQHPESWRWVERKEPLSYRPLGRRLPAATLATSALRG